MKLKIWITILLLGCFISSLANEHNNPSTGELEQQVDSVLISYDDLRLANSKLIELEFEKEINYKLKQIINNDSIIIKDYTKLTDKLNKDCKKAIRQRDIAISTIIFVTLVGSLLFILK